MKSVIMRGLGSLTNTPISRASSSSFSRFLHRFLCSNAATDVDSPPSSPLKDVGSTLLQPRVVVYDGVCHLCHRGLQPSVFKWRQIANDIGVKWVIKADKDRKIKFCCVQSNAAEPYLRACGLEREDVLRRFLFIEGLNVYSQGSTAALRVLSYLPLPYSTLSSLCMIPTPIRDAVYDYVAKQRYEWFGKAEDCLVLREKELLERFIDREEMMNRGPDL